MAETTYHVSGLFVAWLMAGDPSKDRGVPSKGRGVPSRVWACEPLPKNVALLKSNLQAHGLADKVRPVLCCAVLYYICSVTMVPCPVL